MTDQRWEKKYLFECYELQYTNKEIYFEKNGLYVNPIIPFNNELIKTASDYKREEIKEKQVKQLRRDAKKVTWNTLTELNTKITSFFYESEDKKAKGEQCLEKIIEILEEKGEDFLLNKLI